MRTWTADARRAARAGLLAATLLVPAAVAYGHDDAGAWSGELELASDYVLRGVSQTRGEPALQAGAAYAAGALTAGAWASNVAFDDAVAGSDDGAHVELDLYVSRTWRAGARLAIDTTLVRYLYPGTARGVDYDYDELVVAWRWGETVSGSIYWSHDAFASGRPAAGYEIGIERALPGGFVLMARAGRYELGRVYGAGYGYWHASIARTVGPIAVGLRYEASDRAGERLWEDIADGRVVLTLGASS
jgi:uncharacterized protein (TIGR02001 family)